MLSKKKLEPGAEIEAFCSKCKGPSIHVIEAIKNDTITRVMCKSCLSSHKYKPVEEAPPKKKSASTAKKTTSTAKKTPKAKKPPKTKEERKWARLMAKADENNQTDYEMSGSYSELDVINHSSFGVGVVVKVIQDNKVSVAFQDGVKTLIQNQ
jgi:hypothetical protein